VVLDRVRIKSAARTLVGPALIEARVPVGFANAIGRQDESFLAQLDVAGDERQRQDEGSGGGADEPRED
jgi:hypothetical protein